MIDLVDYWWLIGDWLVNEVVIYFLFGVLVSWVVEMLSVMVGLGVFEVVWLGEIWVISLCIFDCIFVVIYLFEVVVVVIGLVGVVVSFVVLVVVW